MNIIFVAVLSSVCTTIVIDWIKEYQFRRRVRKAVTERIEQIMREQEQTL